MKSLLSCYAVAIFLSVCYYLWKEVIDIPTVKPGQIWLENYNDPDPFADKKYPRLKVIKVKEGWALSIRYWHTKSDTVSNDFKDFNKMKLLKPVK